MVPLLCTTQSLGSVRSISFSITKTSITAQGPLSRVIHRYMLMISENTLVLRSRCYWYASLSLKLLLLHEIQTTLLRLQTHCHRAHWQINISLFADSEPHLVSLVHGFSPPSISFLQNSPLLFLLFCPFAPDYYHLRFILNS